MSNRVYPKAVTDRGFETITPSPHFPAMEESVLKYWDVDDTFRRSIAQRDSGNANDESSSLMVLHLLMVCHIMVICSPAMLRMLFLVSTLCWARKLTVFSVGILTVCLQSWKLKRN